MTNIPITKGKRKRRLNTHLDFLKKIKENEENGCWEWAGSLNKDGYGQFTINSKCFATHRYSFKYYKGEIGGLCVLHTCDNPCCCNPDHLFLGTPSDNMSDCVRKGRWRNPNPHQKLTKDQVVEIRNLLKTMKKTDVAKLFNISKSAITQIFRRNTWQNI